MFLPTETSTFLFVFKTLQWPYPGKSSSCDHRDKEGTTLHFPCHLLRGRGKQNSAHSEPQYFMTVSGHFQATVVLIPGKELWYPLYMRLCVSQKRAGHGEGKIPCPLSVPSNYSPSVSILHWYERYNVINSAASHSRMHTHTYTECSAWGWKLQSLCVWVHLSKNHYRNITPYYQPLRRYEQFNICRPVWP